MKTLTLLLATIIINNLAFAQNENQNSLDKIKFSEGVVYQKIFTDIGDLPTQFQSTKLQTLVVNPVNKAFDQIKTVVIRTYEVIGSRAYERNCSISIAETKLLIKFLGYVKDSVISREPIKEEEFGMTLSDDFKVMVFGNQEKSWKICFTLDNHYKHNVFIKTENIEELINLFQASIVILEGTR